MVAVGLASFARGLHLGAPRAGEDRGIVAMIGAALLLRRLREMLSLCQTSKRTVLLSQWGKPYHRLCMQG